MMVLTCSTTYVPFLCQRLGFAASPMSQCIVCADAETNEPIAGVVYDNYNGATIHAHIWIAEGKKPSREWYYAIFDYPLVQLKVSKIIGQVNSKNKSAMKLDSHFGFVLEAEITEYYDDGGSLLVYTMKKEQCRILNSKSWQKVATSIVRGVNHG